MINRITVESTKGRWLLVPIPDFTIPHWLLIRVDGSALDIFVESYQGIPTKHDQTCAQNSTENLEPFLGCLKPEFRFCQIPRHAMIS